MAIDPRILLTPVTPDIGNALVSGFEAGQRIGQRYRESKQEAELQPMRQRLLEAQISQAEAQAAGAPAKAEAERIANQQAMMKMRVQGAAMAIPDVLKYIQNNDLQGLESWAAQTPLLMDDDKAELIQNAKAGNVNGILQDVYNVRESAYGFGVLERPPVESKTNIEKNLEAAGFIPDTPEFRAAVMEQLNRPTGTQVSIQMPSQQGLTAEAKALGDVRAKRFQAIQNQGDSASATLDSLSQLYTLNTQTGLGEQTKADIAGVLNAVGVRGDDLLNVDTANVESANKIISKLVAEAMTNQKGVASENDRALYTNIAPSIKDKEQAYKFNIASTSAVAQRQVDKSNFYNDWFEQNGNLVGVDKAWSNYTKSTPLFQRGVVGSDGLPQNYYQFRDAFLQIPANSGAPEEDIRQQWLLAPKVLKKNKGGL